MPVFSPRRHARGATVIAHRSAGGGDRNARPHATKWRVRQGDGYLPGAGSEPLVLASVGWGVVAARTSTSSPSEIRCYGASRFKVPTPPYAPSRDELGDERFTSKAEARSGVAYLGVLKLIEKGLIDERLNPKRTRERLQVRNPSAPTTSPGGWSRRGSIAGTVLSLASTSGVFGSRRR